MTPIAPDGEGLFDVAQRRSAPASDFLRRGGVEGAHPGGAAADARLGGLAAHSCGAGPAGEASVGGALTSSITPQAMRPPALPVGWVV